MMHANDLDIFLLNEITREQLSFCNYCWRAAPQLLGGSLLSPSRQSYYDL